MYFIDKKIRENFYPTTVSLARDYVEKYGQSVNSRTIAGDIASLKAKFHAPLSYDYQKKGYFYTNPNFQLPVLKDDPEDPLPTMAAEVHPRTAAIPEWQQAFIASLVDKVLPFPKGQNQSKGKASVLLNNMVLDTDFGAVAQPLMHALNSNTAVRLSYAFSGKKPIEKIFRPIHLICALEMNLVFGTIKEEKRERYALLYLDRIREVSPCGKMTAPPSYVAVQTIRSRDIEVVIALEKSDVLLIFTCAPNNAPAKFLPEYTLLVQTEIFAEH
ncbi:hypothetical protein TREAZ_0139 [Leadbettera azotonutricia ZAS-9]|uniref:WYL domain-containing protein n=2 Tax=Leadbettera azotonutricia TaxID=150829 RepID=F5YEY5_LEAAZ|nr:hypothetical protein TREAZ_0139 [Leadbettera azotonutricia ZAS-9]